MQSQESLQKIPVKNVCENSEVDNTVQIAAGDSAQSIGPTNVIATPITAHPQMSKNNLNLPVYRAFVNGNPPTIANIPPTNNNGAHVSFYPHLPIPSTWVTPYQMPLPFPPLNLAQQPHEYIPSKSFS